MDNKDSVLLIVVGVVAALLLAAAAMFLVARPTAGSAGSSAAPGFGLGFSVSYARTPGGMTATLTVTNKGTQAVEDLRLVIAHLASMNGTRPLPFAVGTVPAAGAATVTLPFTGPAPAANAPLQLTLHYDFKGWFFSRGGGASTVTAVLP